MKTLDVLPAREVVEKRSEEISPSLGVAGVAQGAGPWMLVGAVLVLWGLRFGLGVGESVWFSVADVGAVASGLGIAVASPWLASSPRARFVHYVILAVVLGAFVAWAWQQILLAPAYATDELAFDQYAAHLLLHGVDPYRASLANAFPRYQVSPDAYTLRFNGSPVTSLSYPALSFLVYVPMLLAGIHMQAGEIVDITAWAITILLTWVTVRNDWRPLVLVLVSLSAYIAYAVGGVTDALYVPLLVGVAASMPHYLRRSRWGWIAPLLLGTAMAIKQTPWLIAPFLAEVVLLVVADSEGWRAAWTRLGLFVTIAASAFIVWQVPFILWAPHAWLAGVLTPFDSSVVPAGQGLVALTLAFGVGGGGFSWLTLLSIVYMAGGLIILWFAWPHHGWLAFALPVLALFFATRSFGSYFVNLIPAALVALGSWPRSRVELSRRPLLITLAALGTITLGALVLWVTSPPPLSVRILGVHTSGQLATIDRVTLAVANSSNHPITPNYVAELAGSFSSPWVRLSGPTIIPAHSSKTVVVEAPNFPAQPSVAGGFQMVSFAKNFVAPSALYEPGLLHVVLVPDALNHPIPFGKTVVLEAELVNRLDERVRQAGVPVYLGQAVYAQRGLLYGSAAINRSGPGATPVEELTGPDGVADFRIVDHGSQPDPISFEANLVSTQGFYPYGYSQIVPIRFVPVRNGR
ncbi:hypothetical protein [Ferrimicrobium sp.]|uniref:hypothetical protein n=1 Tax=Ferrimicrobium sp. TaxID=2926050 RepID=UPI00260265EF|nr:hypothetical protein [Ferrimicrobium sp.]